MVAAQQGRGMGTWFPLRSRRSAAGIFGCLSVALLRRDHGYARGTRYAGHSGKNAFLSRQHKLLHKDEKAAFQHGGETLCALCLFAPLRQNECPKDFASPQRGKEAVAAENIFDAFRWKVLGSGFDGLE